MNSTRCTVESEPSRSECRWKSASSRIGGRQNSARGFGEKELKRQINNWLRCQPESYDASCMFDVACDVLGTHGIIEQREDCGAYFQCSELVDCDCHAECDALRFNTFHKPTRLWDGMPVLAQDDISMEGHDLQPILYVCRSRCQ